jgi:cation diffusion facilitator family transporter
MNELELKAGLKVTWVGVWTNVVLVILKLVVGFWGKSQALVADGVHSTSDLFSDAVVLLGLRYGRKEADQQHPYGHGKIETLGSLTVGVILFAVGVGVAVHAIGSILHTETMNPSVWGIWVAAFSIVIKEWLYWYTVKVGRRIRSSMLIANAWHHRTDALSSVAVLIGIFAAWAKPEWRIADSLAALVVAYPIIRVSISFGYSALQELIDTVPGEEVIKKIEKIALETEGVIAVHDITARRSGPDMMMELHLVVDPHQTVFEGHRVANTVEKRLLDEIEGALRVTIHVDPDTDPDRHPSL